MKTKIKQTPITKSAKDEACTLRCAPDFMGCDPPETTVLCHAPYPGRAGTRTHDWWAAYGCMICHAIVDFRYRLNGKPWLSQEEVDGVWMRAIHETQEKLFEKGLLEVKEP